MPAPPHSLHQPALHGERPANFIGGCCLLRGLYWPDRRQLLLQGLCRSDRPPAVLACNGLVLRALLACHLCHAMPTAPVHQPPFILLCPHLFISMCAGIIASQQFASCKNCPVGSYNAGLQWRPVPRIASTPHSLCCKDCPVGSRAGRLHLCSPCAVVRCGHVKRGRPRTACEQPAKFPTPAC